MKDYVIYNKYNNEYEHFKARDIDHAKEQLSNQLYNIGLEDSVNELESDWEDYYSTEDQAIKAHAENFSDLRLMEYGDFKEIKDNDNE